jgi:hypothetical protein
VNDTALSAVSRGGDRLAVFEGREQGNGCAEVGLRIRESSD